MNRVQFDPKRQGETSTYGVNFAGYLGASATITGCTVTASVYTGTDPSPSSIISGSASISSPVVSQKITGGVVGVIYEILFSAGTSDGQTINAAGFLAVIPDLT